MSLHVHCLSSEDIPHVLEQAISRPLPYRDQEQGSYRIFSNDFPQGCGKSIFLINSRNTDAQNRPVFAFSFVKINDTKSFRIFVIYAQWRRLGRTLPMGGPESRRCTQLLCHIR